MKVYETSCGELSQEGYDECYANGPAENDEELQDRPALLDAVYHGDFEAVAGLLEMTKELDGVRGERGETALHVAALGGDPRMVKMLLDAGADINARNDLQQTPLAVAVAGDNEQNALALLAGGADINHAFRGKGTLLDLATLNNSCCCIGLLVDAGVDPNVPGVFGYPPIFSAKEETLEALLAAGANPNVRDSNGSTPLHLVRDSRSILSLLTAGADLNARDTFDRTPIYKAASSTAFDAFRTLIEAGADPHIKAKDGRTAADVADSRQMEFLLASGEARELATEAAKPAERPAGRGRRI